MATTVQGRAMKEANATLHRLLDHYKSSWGLTTEERVDPAHFFPINTRLLISLNGWTLDEVSMVGHTSSLSEVAAKCVRAEKKIVLLSTLPEEVKRYTLAHELGHALLHTDTPNCDGRIPEIRPRFLSATDRVRAAQYSDTEREAEIYARELLMPDRAVRRHFRELFGVTEIRAASQLAAQFAPRAHSIAVRGSESVNVRAAAAEIANRSTPPLLSLTHFFGVSTSSMVGRLMGLYLVY